MPKQATSRSTKKPATAADRTTTGQKRLLVLRVGKEHEKRGRRNPEFPEINIRATAEKIGITESHLSRLLMRKTRPGLKTARKLANLFGMTLEQVERIYHDDKCKLKFQIDAA